MPELRRKRASWSSHPGKRDERPRERHPGQFAIRLEGRSAKPVTVDWATSAGTATPGQDYTEASGTLTIAPGKTSGAIQVAVTDDDLDEDDETLTVTLSAPANATLAEGGATANGVIVDNDGLPKAVISDARASEEEGELEFAIRLEGRRVAPLSAKPT